MKIGLVNLFPYRPHVATLEYLAQILEAEHEVFFLTCDSGLDYCHNLLLNHKNYKKGCIQCRIGGIRSYRKTNVTSIKNRLEMSPPFEPEQVIYSTLASSLRAETHEYLNLSANQETIEKLNSQTGKVFANVKEWIEKNELEALICFNGRMDVHASIIKTAEHLKIPYITYEYAWLGDGIQLIPNSNCLSLVEPLKIIDEFKDKSLSRIQIAKAVSKISKRINKTSFSEWRQYNMNPEDYDWKVDSERKLKVIILPSSFNEFLGHSEYESDWANTLEAFDACLERLNKRHELDVILRCHPNWAEEISGVSGDHIESSFENWAGQTNNVKIIRSSAKANTFELIKQSDIVLLNLSSAVLEAGILGKKIISVTPSRFQNSGIVENVLNELDLDKLNNIEKAAEPDQDVILKTLRFMYCYLERIPQYTQTIKSVSPTQLNYHKGADANIIVEMIKSGELKAFDDSFSETMEEEKRIMPLILQQNWKELERQSEEELVNTELQSVERRGLYRLLDTVRDWFPRGDMK